jgi:hypothetical protein
MPLTGRLSSIWRSHPLLDDILFAHVAGTVVAAASIPAGADQLDVRAMDTPGFALAGLGAAAWRSTRLALFTAGLAILAHVPWSLLVETDGPLLTLAATMSWIAAPVGVGSRCGPGGSRERRRSAARRSGGRIRICGC